MTVLASIPSRQYTPQTFNLSPTIPSNTKKLVISLTRESWPLGPVGSISIQYPDGTDATSQTFAGGIQSDRNGNPVVVQTMILDGKFQNGVQQTIPQGKYDTAIVVLQTLNTAVTAEAF